jgi:AbrB family looped-hinge helix DNA binding protein
MASKVSQKQNKSEAIRTLAEKGFSRSEIAKKMGVRYQFVRNVLVHQESKKTSAKAGEGNLFGHVAKASLDQGGRILIPAPFREALGLKENQVLVLSIEDGEIRIRTREAALKHVQAFVRSFVPEGVSLSDELIEERRREEERERLRD